MAVVIPSDLMSAADAERSDVRVAEALSSGLPDDAWIWYNSPCLSSRPRFIVISPTHGVVGIDVYDWSTAQLEAATLTTIRSASGELLDPIGDLGRRLEAIREELQSGCPRTPIAGYVFLPNLREEELRGSPLSDYFPPCVALSSDTLEDSAWIETIRPLPHPLEPGLIQEVRGQLYPETQFYRCCSTRDRDRGELAKLRLQLDDEQESLARSLSKDITIISGVSGSGKSLVLCARARVLAREKPDWNMQILCFNRSLIGYLRDLVGDEAHQVQIDTFYGWTRRLGIHVPWIRGEWSERTTQRTIEQAVARGLGIETCDAMLIDEGQDFAASWLALAHQALKPGRGGMVIATDMAQCIYREESPSAAFSPENVTRIVLGRNYRNTEQIGRFALRAVFGPDNESSAGDCDESARAPALPTFALDGDPVQMVWADRWDEQASFVAREIERVVGDGRAAYGDIAVLYTQRSGMVRRILSALDARSLPHFWVNRDQDAKTSINRSDNTIKVITVHSSKGLEFPIVFLFGVEALRVPESLDRSSEEDANRTRVAYVGMTRAQDRLYLTYTRPNPILDRALSLKQWCDFKAYPEDYDFE